MPGLYDFLFREYHPVSGRWIQPDPAGLSAVSMEDPQTWNRYAYVRNNPLSMIDPLGLKQVYVEVCTGPPDDRTCHYEWVSVPDDPGNGGGECNNEAGGTSGPCGATLLPPLCSNDMHWPCRPKKAANNGKPQQTKQECEKAAHDWFNNARTVVLAQANQTFQNNWRPTVDWAGTTSFSVLIGSKLAGNPITARVVGTAVVVGLTARATWFGLKSEGQFLYNDMANAGVLQAKLQACQDKP